MGLFKPYDAAPETSTSSAGKKPKTPSPARPVPTSASKKSIPTPTRKQAEEARRQRLNPTLTTKQAKDLERKAKYKARDEVTAKVNALPYNGMIRDWVDHRWNLVEFVLPGMLLVFVVAMIASIYLPTMMVVATYIMWGVLALIVADVAWMWMGCRTQLRIHFPNEPLKGKFGYALSRAMSMRRSRT
ncbi:MAG: DUF3043 domain-containing protein, partial [Propionibacteriaceae bacterium]|nr:DUF3043 domain-containing protein [Propionibacteriaceae bacterium]